MENIEQRVRDIFAKQFGLNPADIKDDDTWESLKGDSLDEIEIAMAIEDDFGIEIPDTQLEKLHSVSQFIAYVQENVKA